MTQSCQGKEEGRRLFQPKYKGSGLSWSVQHGNLSQSTLIECPFCFRSWDHRGMCNAVIGLKEYHIESETGREGVVLPQIRFPRRAELK